MNDALFKSLMEDDLIQKFDLSGGGIFLSENKKLVINFCFFHMSFPNIRNDNRILLSVLNYDPNFFEDFPLINVSNQFTILCNAREPDYALTYEVIINENDSSAYVKIKDYPNAGSSLIQENERLGIKAMVN